MLVLQIRQLIPPLTMHIADGRTVRAWDFKQKRNLVIVFLDANCGPCEEFLQQLVQRASDLAATEAIALVAFLDLPPRGLGESVPPEIILGVDVSGRSARAFLGEAGISSGSRGGQGVFVTDRYGELAAQWIAVQHEFPSVDEVLTTLHGIEITCECRTPHWFVEN